MRPQLKAQSQLKGLLEGYYQRLGSGASPVAWCTSVGPAEVLRSFGYEVYFPENHGALLGAKRLGSKYIPLANSAGYSPETCSYMTSDIGAFLAGQSALELYGLSSVPKPAVLAFNTSQCREVKEWFSFYGHSFESPVLGIHTPTNIDEITPALLDYLAEAWRELILELESHSGHKFDKSRFEETLALSHEACQLWQRFLDTCQRKPVQHTFFDHVFLMAPVVVLRGTQEAVEFYKQLLAEVESLEEMPATEQYRLFWEGMPIWGKLRYLADAFSERNVSVVASTYCHSWAFDFASGDPFQAMVKAYASIFITRSERYKLQYLKAAAQKFDISGFMFHDAKCCPHNSNSRFALPSRLQAQTSIPAMTFFGDLVDLRHFSDEEFIFRLEAFLENIA